jgi:hypothetical protein
MDTLDKVILGGTAMYLSNEEIFQTRVVEKNEKMSNSLFLCVLEISR